MYRVDNKNKKEYRKVTTKAKYFVVISLFLLLLLVIVGSSSWNLHLRVIGFTKPATIVSGTDANSLLLKYVDVDKDSTPINKDGMTFDYIYTYNGTQQAPQIHNIVKDKDGNDYDARDFDLSKFKYEYTCLYIPNDATNGEWEAVASQTSSTTAPTNAGLYKVEITYLDPDSAFDYSSYIGSPTLYFAIKPKPIPVTVSRYESVYGDELVEIKEKVDESLLCGDSVDSLNSGFSLQKKNSTFSLAGEDLRLEAGEYNIICTDNSRNFAITYNPENPNDETYALYTIKKRPITVKILNQTSVYGDPLFDFTKLENWNNNSIAELTANTSLSAPDKLSDVISINVKSSLSDDTLPINAGSYPIVGETINPNYEVTFANGSWSASSECGIYTITKAPLTITANSAETTYGEAAPQQFTATFAGIKNGETINISYSCDYQIGDNVGNYDIIPSLDGTYNNYETTLNKGTLTVNKRNITVTIKSSSSTYGDAIPMLQYEITSGTVYNNERPFTLSTEATSSSPVGSYSVTGSATEEVAKNYNIIFVHSGEKLYTITPATLTITANNISVVYGDNPVYTATYSGFANGEDTSILCEPVTFDCDYEAGTSQVGQPLTITPVLSNQTNYIINVQTGTLTVKQREVALNWIQSTLTLTYNGEEQKPSVTCGNVYGTDSVTVQTIEIEKSGERDGIDVGTYTAKATKLSNGNYKLPADASTKYTITALEALIEWGGVFEFTYNGKPQAPTARVTNLQGSDVCNVNVSGNGTDVGNYTAKVSSLGNDNYKLPQDEITNSFRINEIVLTLTFDSTSFEYDKTKKVPNVTALNGVIAADTGKVSASITTKTESINVGNSYTADISLTGDKAKNYTLSQSTVGYSITPRILKFTWSAEELVYNGSEQAPLITINNLVSGDSVDITISGKQTNAGINYTATATGLTGMDKNNYVLPEAGCSVIFNITGYEIDLSEVYWTCDNNRINEIPMAVPYESGRTYTIDLVIPDSIRNAPKYGEGITIRIKDGSDISKSELGDYLAEAEVISNNNYVLISLIAKLSWSITSSVNRPTVKSTGVYTYDGIAKELSELFDYNSTHVNVSMLSFTLPGATETSTLPSECKNAGKYVYRFELKDSATTSWTTAGENFEDLEITINPIPVTLRIKDSGHTYGDTQMGTLTFTVVRGKLANNEPLNGVMSLKTDATIDSLPGTGNIGGNWTITPNTKNPNYDITTQGNYNNTYGVYTVDKKSITVNTVFSLTYSETGRTWNDIKAKITEKLGSADIFGGLLGSDTVTLSFTSMSNGVITYSGNSCSIDSNYSAAYTNAGITTASLKTQVPGSTYVLSGLSIESDKYKLVSSQIILKYKTAKIGNTYYTIEDALYQTNSTISFAGDASNYVLTTFSHIDPSEYNNITSADGFAAYASGTFNSNIQISVFSYSIGNGNTLLVPYNDSLNEYEQKYGDSTSSVYSALFIDKGIKITVNSGSALVTGSIIDGVTGVNQRGVIINEGIIDVKNGGAIRSYGYIKSSSLDSEWGTILAEKGATVLDVMTVYNWIGGNSAKNVYKKAFPVNAWSIHNISCAIKFGAGSVFNVFAAVTADSKVYSAIGCIISSSKNGGGMFYPENANDANSYIVKKAIPANSWIETDTKYKSLYTVTGYNSTEGQKDIIEVYGNYRDCAINVSLAGLVEMDTGLEKSAPLPYMDVYLKNGANFTMESSDYSFMPGTKLVIEENATLTVGNGVDVAFLNVECFDIIGQTKDAMTKRLFIADCIDKVAAYIEVNGNLVVNGKISGLIKSSVANSTLILNSTSSATFTTVTAAYGMKEDLFGTKNYYYKGTANIVMQGIQTDNSNVATTFTNAVTYFSIASSWVDPNDANIKICYWGTAETVKTITFNFNGGSGMTAKKTVILEKDANGNLISHIITDADLQDATREHYTFDGWYMDQAFTTPAEGYSITTDCDVYAKWVADQYDITYEYPGLSDEQKTGVDGSNLDTYYVYGEELQLKKPTHSSLNFVGWYSDIDLKNEITSITVGKYNNITIYGKWTDDTPCTYDVTLDIGDISGVSFDENSSILSFKGTVNGGASAVIGDVYANYGSIRDLLNEDFMNSNNLATIKDQKHYNFDSYFGGWKLSYTRDGSTIEKSYANARPAIEIDGGATDIKLTAQWLPKVALNIVFNDLVDSATVPHAPLTKYFKPGLEIPKVGVEMLIPALVTLEYYDYINFEYNGENTADNIILENISEGVSPTITANYKKWFTISKTNPDTELIISIPSGKTGVGLDNGKLRVSTTINSINIAEYFKSKDENTQYVESYSSAPGTITNNSLNLSVLSSKDEIVVTAVVKKYVTITFDVNGSGLETPSAMKFRQGAIITNLPWGTGQSYTSGCGSTEYFQGWYTAKSGGNKVKNGDTINGDLKLYAQWGDSENSNPNAGCVEFAKGGSDGPNAMMPIFVSFVTAVLGGYIILNRKKKKNAEK